MSADRGTSNGLPVGGPGTATRSHVGIIGGGMLGLGLAARLARAGHRVTVIEGATALGGLAAAVGIGDVTWDRFYHVTLLSDSYLRELLDDIGLGDRLRWRTTRTGFFTGGRLVSMSSALDFLMFPPLGLFAKARLGWTIFYASRVKDPAPLEQVTVVDWLTRLSGRSTVERIWLPLLRSKLGENYRLASAAFIWAIIRPPLPAARRSGLKREMLRIMSRVATMPSFDTPAGCGARKPWHRNPVRPPRGQLVPPRCVAMRRAPMCGSRMDRPAISMPLCSPSPAAASPHSARS